MHPETPSSAETQYTEMEGGLAAFADEGVGPVLVCIHGIPGSSHDFRWIAPVLAPHMRVLRIDLQGFGGTPRAAHPDPDMNGMADFVRLFLDALEIDRVALLGHSLGGAIATQAAIDPRVLALVLVASAGPFSHRGHFPKTYKCLVPFSRIGLTRPLLTVLVKKVLQWAGFRIGNSDETALTTLECAASIDFNRHGETLSSIDKPTMVIWAEDDRMVEPRVSKTVTRIAPAGPRLHFDSGGHNIQKTRANEIAAALCPWLKAQY